MRQKIKVKKGCLNACLFRRQECLLYDEGCEITVQQAIRLLRKMRTIKRRDPARFDEEGYWHCKLMLLQHIQFKNKEAHERIHNGGKGDKSEVSILTQDQNRLLKRKIEKVAPETYPCGILIKALEA